MYLYCDLIKARFMEGTWRMVWVSSSKSFCLLVLIWLFFFFLSWWCGSDWWWGIKTDLFILLERFGTQSIIFTGLIGVCCFLPASSSQVLDFEVMIRLQFCKVCNYRWFSLSLFDGLWIVVQAVCTAMEMSFLRTTMCMTNFQPFSS